MTAQISLHFGALVLLVLVVCLSSSTPTLNGKWRTLDGSSPLVIARGGLSGMFPYASEEAYKMALNLSVPDVVMWCDVQLTKDDHGLCLPNLVLNKYSNVDVVYPNRANIYFVNGVRTKGYFPIDFNLEQLLRTKLAQDIYLRPHYYNDVYDVKTVDNVFKLFIEHRAAGFWLNIQHPSFYAQHNLSMTSYIIRISKHLNISHISSSDIGFLRGLKEPFASSNTSLVFCFLDQDEHEPSTEKSYGFLLSNLTYIKTFASGILVPKVYIWPVDETSYLLPHTNLVADAHWNGLPVFAYGFANDKINAHNYSSNPIAEYLSFIDNGNFSVDGLVSDFPLTSSAAIECFAHVRHSACASVQAMPKPLVISNCGASGVYPGCTDLAYRKAISDGSDAIDCPVQMSKDGVPFCSSSVNLIASTLVFQTEFRKFASVINEIQSNMGIFSFSLNWSDIQALTPALSNPYGQVGLFGNPKFSKSGKVVSLSDFLEIANASSVPRVLFKIENARYLAEKQGMSSVDAVLVAIRNFSIFFPRDKRIMIQSTSSAVLKAMQGKGFELVYEVQEAIQVMDIKVIEDIRLFAHSVVLNKDSVFFNNNGFLRSWTHVVDYFHAFLIPVYVQGFRNEYVSIPYDFYYDPVIEINSYVGNGRVEGLITAFPQTAVDYRNNLCLTTLDKKVKYMGPMTSGELVSLVPDELRPVMPGAFPNLTEGEVLEPPLPAVVSNASLHHSPPPQVGATSTGALPRRLTAFLSCLYIVLSL